MANIKIMYNYNALGGMKGGSEDCLKASLWNLTQTDCGK